MTSTSLLIAEPSSTTTVRPQQAPVTTVAATQTTTNNATVLRVDRTDESSILITAGTFSDGGDPLDLSLRLASAVDQTAIDLGYVSVQVALNDILASEAAFGVPVSVRLPSLPSDGVVATSADDVMWQRIPLLSSRELGYGQTLGYFIDSDRSVIVLTTRPVTVGIRKQRPQLEILGVRPTVTPRSANKLDVAGQAGESPIILTVNGSEGSCAVSRSGVFMALDGGECRISAVQGGGTMYMSAESDSVVSLIQNVEVVRSAITRYRTSVMMVLLMVGLGIFLLWQVTQTFVDVRRALRTDPEKL